MILQANNLKSSPDSRKKKKRLGRGNASTLGNYSGRGMKGQKARSGGKGGLKLRGFKQLLQSTPKLSGFKSGRIKPIEISTKVLELNFSDGETVNVNTLKEKNILGKNNKTAKIILNGELKKKLTIEGLKVTKGAKEMIEKVGGSIKS